MKKLILFTIFFTFFLSTKALAMADSAFSACIMNAATGEIVWEKNGYEKHAMASTTKIMTAIVALENSSADDVVTVSASAARTEGSAMYIHGGDQFLMKNMLCGLMLNSGNDAAEAIAEHVAGSSEGFAELMNQKAYEIGAVNTQFQNPSGLDDDGHYTTACDLALITKYGLQNKEFCDIISIEYTEVTPLDSDRVLPLSNHNKLLDSYEGCIGVKTGYTKNTGRCLVSAATRNGMTFIAVTLDDPNDWKNHKAMLDYCFETHRPLNITKSGDKVNDIVIGDEKCSLIYSADFTIPVRIEENAEVEIKNHIVPSFYGGVNKGEKLGEGEIIYKGKSIVNIDIISDRQVSASDEVVRQKSFLGVLEIMLKNFLL